MERSFSAEFVIKKHGLGMLEKPNPGARCQAEAILKGCSHIEALVIKKKKRKNSTQIIQARPSLDAFVIAYAALPRKEETK